LAADAVPAVGTGTQARRRNILNSIQVSEDKWLDTTAANVRDAALRHQRNGSHHWRIVPEAIT
jgi:hypothetical protein